MQNTLNKIRKNNFRNLKGTDLNIKIPIKDYIIIDFLRSSVKHEKIEHIRFDINPRNDNTFSIAMIVKVNNISKPTVTFTFKLEETYYVKKNGFSDIAKIEEERCSIWIGKKAIINKLKEGLKESLPSYLTMEYDTIRFNLYKLLEESDFKFIIDYTNKIYIKTKCIRKSGWNNPADDRIWIEFQLKI